MNHSLKLYSELYRRGIYDKIPIGRYSEAEGGELFYPTKKQIKTLGLLNDDVTTSIGYGGSARSGKSIIECSAIILECLAYDGIAWGLGRRELTTLKRTVLLTLFTQFEFYGLDSSEYNYNQQLNRIDFQNGSTIFLIDTATKPSDPLNTRFGGFELTRCAIDESNETDISVVNKLFERTGWRLNGKYGLKRKVLETFNPAKNHVYTRYYVPFRDQNEVENKRFIAALPSDNPHPSVQEWIDDLIRTADEVTIQRQVHGNFDYDDDPSALCQYDKIMDIFTNDHVRQGRKRISADLAMQGRDRFIGGHWSGLIAHVDIDMPKSSGKTIEISLKDLKNREQVPNSSIVADADGLGSYLESYIENIVPFHGNKRAFNDKYANVKTECAFKLAELINRAEIKVVCSPEQKERIASEISMCLKRDKIDADTQKVQLISKDKMKLALGRSPDYLDFLLMGMWFHIKPEYETVL